MAGIKTKLDSLTFMGTSEAYKVVKELARKHPNNYDVLLAARKYAMRSKDLDAAKKYLKRAGEYLPLDSDMDFQLTFLAGAWTKLGDQYYRTKKYNDALYSYEQSIEAQASYLALYNAVTVADELNKKQDVIKYGETLLRDYPDKAPWDVKKILVKYYSPIDALRLMEDYPRLLKAGDKKQITIFMDNYAKAIESGSPIAQSLLDKAYAIFNSAQAAWPTETKTKKWKKALDKIVKTTNKVERTEWNRYSTKPGSSVDTEQFVRNYLVSKSQSSEDKAKLLALAKVETNFNAEAKNGILNVPDRAAEAYGMFSGQRDIESDIDLGLRILDDLKLKGADPYTVFKLWYYGELDPKGLTPSSKSAFESSYNRFLSHYNSYLDELNAGEDDMEFIDDIQLPVDSAFNFY